MIGKLLFNKSVIHFAIAIALASSLSQAATLDFQLLTWNDTNATAQLPSAAGRKPSATFPAAGDWLVLTDDDAVLPALNNPSGAFSHNFVDLTGAGGAGFNLAPSLTGALTLELELEGDSQWTVAVSALAFSGHANAMQRMNEFLVTASSPAAANSALAVDGIGNSGQWLASASNNWAIQFQMDFYLASSTDGDPGAADIDATFNDSLQIGFLIPVNHLATRGPTAAPSVALDDPLGFYADDLNRYLLEQIVPRLPANATYLLVSQMAKVQPDYVEPGLPLTTSSLIGNTTIAYTTQEIVDAPLLFSIRFENGKPVVRFTGTVAQSYSIQRSTNLGEWLTVANPVFSYPEPEVVEWADTHPLDEKQFYRVISLAP